MLKNLILNLKNSNNKFYTKRLFKKNKIFTDWDNPCLLIFTTKGNQLMLLTSITLKIKWGKVERNITLDKLFQGNPGEILLLKKTRRKIEWRLA